MKIYANLSTIQDSHEFLSSQTDSMFELSQDIILVHIVMFVFALKLFKLDCRYSNEVVNRETPSKSLDQHYVEKRFSVHDSW